MGITKSSAEVAAGKAITVISSLSTVTRAVFDFAARNHQDDGLGDAWAEIESV